MERMGSYFVVKIHYDLTWEMNVYPPIRFMQKKFFTLKPFNNIF